MALAMAILDTTHNIHLDHQTLPSTLSRKRIHPPHLHNSMPPPISVVPQSQSRKRKLIPEPNLGPSASTSKISSPSSEPMSSPDPDDSEYPPSRGKRSGGGKGGNGNGRPLSREALRKANHSLIERRRREKINHALGELRSMVPGLGDAGGKGGEFKLEVSGLTCCVLHPRLTRHRC